MYNNIKKLIETERAQYTGAIFKNFSKHLKQLRKTNELSQKSLAEKLGVPVSTYANWEQGRREPKLFDYYNILYVLDISYEEFFDFM